MVGDRQIAGERDDVALADAHAVVEHVLHRVRACLHRLGPAGPVALRATGRADERRTVDQHVRDTVGGVVRLEPGPHPIVAHEVGRPVAVDSEWRDSGITDGAGRPVAELGRPQSTGPARPRVVRGDAGRELRVDHRRVRLEGQVGVGGRSGEQLDDACACEPVPDGEQATPLLHVGVVLAQEAEVPPPVGRERRHLRTHEVVPALLLAAPHRRRQPAGQLFGEPWVGELPGGRRGDAEGQQFTMTDVRESLQRPGDRKPRGAPGLEQPLLADGPDPVACEVWEMGVQDECEFTRCCVGCCVGGCVGNIARRHHGVCTPDSRFGPSPDGARLRWAESN